jgi:ubiquitin-protein ligase
MTEGIGGDQEIRQIQKGKDLCKSIHFLTLLKRWDDANDAWVVALAVTCEESDIRNVKALIMGPAESPYQFGFFEVHFFSNFCLPLAVK